MNVVIKHIKKIFLGNDKNIEKKAYVWVILGAGTFSSISPALLFFVTRFLGTEEAGIFSLGFSFAQLFSIIGLFNIRMFHSTDVMHSYSFGEYFSARILSVIVMLGVSIFFTIINGYYFQKALVLIFLTLLKVSDCFSDVCEGEFQRNKRVDLAGKTQFIKSVLSIIVFIATLLFTKNLIISIILQCTILLVTTLVIDLPAILDFSALSFSFNIKRVAVLFTECLPLFINAFLLMLIYTLPKYAVDRNFPSDYQAYYNILFMPSFVFNLAAAFLINPVLSSLASFWTAKDINGFKRTLSKQIFAFIAILIPLIIGGYFEGIPLLNIVYGVNLDIFKNMFMVLLFGGCFNAFAVLLLSLGVIFRKQRDFMLIYAAAAVVCAIFSFLLPLRIGFEGVAWAYFIAMTVLCTALAGLTIGNMKRKDI